MRCLAASVAVVALVVPGACGGGKPAPRPPVSNTSVPAGGPTTESRLATATSIELRDVWVGLGCTHEFSARLTVSGGGWSGPARLEVGWDHDQPQEKTIAIDAAAIVALDRAVDAARARMAAPDGDGFFVTRWTDDYPSGSMIFTTPGGVYQLGFEDQHRKLVLQHGEDRVPLDRDQDLLDTVPSEIWKAYREVLTAAGLPAWIDATCDRK